MTEENLYSSVRDFRLRRLGHFDAMKKLLSGGQKLLLLSEMPGNTGDRLIWSGSHGLARKSGRLAGLFPVRKGAHRVPKGVRLVIPGSGALVEPYSEWLPQFILDASERASEIVVLPSQADPRVPVVEEAMSRKNVVFFARDLTTWDLVRHLPHRGLSFDPALYAPALWNQSLENLGAASQSGTLVSFRSGPTAITPPKGFAVNQFLNFDASDNTKVIDEFVGVISSKSEVITDRLHVAVVATVAGCRVRVWDPYQSKISSYLRYVFPALWGNQASAISVDELIRREILIPSTPVVSSNG